MQVPCLAHSCWISCSDGVEHKVRADGAARNDIRRRAILRPVLALPVRPQTVEREAEARALPAHWKLLASPWLAAELRRPGEGQRIAADRQGAGRLPVARQFGMRTRHLRPAARRTAPGRATRWAGTAQGGRGSGAHRGRLAVGQAVARSRPMSGGRRGLGEPADADIGRRRSRRWRGSSRARRRPKLRSARGLPTSVTAPRSISGGHIVEQQVRRAGGERGLDLVDPVDLDDDRA